MSQLPRTKLPAGTLLTGEEFRLRSSRSAVDSEGLFAVIQEGLKFYVQEIPPPDGFPFHFIHEFPKERLSLVDSGFSVVTFRVVSVVPSPVKNDGTLSRKPITFWAKDTQNEGYALIQDVYKELLTIEFQIWTASNPTRSKLVNWFHKFILRYANRYKFFEARGADKLQFVGRGEDGFETREEQEIYNGTLTYQVELQFVDTYSERLIDSVTIVSQFGTDQPNILQTA